MNQTHRFIALLMCGILGLMVYFTPSRPAPVPVPVPVTNTPPSDERGAITNYPPKNERIVAFGGSLIVGVGATEGNDMISVLEKRLGVPIINQGVSGNTTTDGVLRLDSVLAEDPGIVLLLLGGNDFLQKIDARITEQNLRTIIERLQKNGTLVVLMGVDGGVLLGQNGGIYELLAHEYGTVLVPDVLEDILFTPELMYDSVHPNDGGYARIAEQLFQVFEQYTLVRL